MKKSVQIVRALQVESSIVSWMFIGYFVLLAASVTLVVQHNNKTEMTTTATTGGSGATHMQMSK